MSAVDVLAVMDRQIELEYNPFERGNQSDEYSRLTEARATVAELIEAASGGSEMQADTGRPLYFSSARANRLRTALARCGGAQ